MNEPRVWADFNGLFGDILCLTHDETARDEQGNRVVLQEGMRLRAFDFDADDSGNPDKIKTTHGASLGRFTGTPPRFAPDDATITSLPRRQDASGGRDDFDAKLPELPSVRGAQHEVSDHRVARPSNSARPDNDMNDRLSVSGVFQIAQRLLCHGTNPKGRSFDDTILRSMKRTGVEYRPRSSSVKDICNHQRSRSFRSTSIMTSSGSR
jgi:hypothetical protein